MSAHGGYICDDDCRSPRCPVFRAWRQNWLAAWGNICDELWLDAPLTDDERIAFEAEELDGAP